MSDGKGQMKLGICPNNFAEVFSKLLEKTNVTCYQIGEFSHLGQGYLSRLKSGKKENPSPETIMLLSLALVHLSDKITIRDIEQLFNSIGRSLLIRHPAIRSIAG